MGRNILVVTSYDNWKTQAPEEPEKCCMYCGEPSEKDFCNKDCKKAYEHDN